jgi:predicted transcriptional regulator
MTDSREHNDFEGTGDDLLRILMAMANPHRLRVLGMLSGGRNYVSQLARDIGMSRPLLHMHLQRLEAAGLIIGHLELSDDGKAMKYYEVAPFALHLTPEVVADAIRSLTTDNPLPKLDSGDKSLESGDKEQ